MGRLRRSLQDYLLAAARVRGAVCAVGSVVLLSWFFGTLWFSYLGYHLWFEKLHKLSILAVGVLAFCLSVWYWVGRPLAVRLADSFEPGELSFSPRIGYGMAGAVGGALLPLFVNPGSRFWVQTLGPLGTVLAVACPLWYWLVGAGECGWLDTRVALPRKRQWLLGVTLLVVTGVALTSVAAHPVSAPNETSVSDGVAVTVTDSQWTQSVNGTKNDTATFGIDDNVTAGENSALLFVAFTVENRAEHPRDYPDPVLLGADPFTLASPTCGKLFFETCPEVTPYNQDFFVEGSKYNYPAYFATLAPGERVRAGIVFEVPLRANDGTRPRATFIAKDIGRWDVSGDGGT